VQVEPTGPLHTGKEIKWSEVDKETIEIRFRGTGLGQIHARVPKTLRKEEIKPDIEKWTGVDRNEIELIKVPKTLAEGKRIDWRRKRPSDLQSEKSKRYTRVDEPLPRREEGDRIAYRVSGCGRVAEIMMKKGADREELRQEISAAMGRPVGIWRIEQEKGRIEIAEIHEHASDMAERTITKVIARGQNRTATIEVDSSYTKKQLALEIERSLGQGTTGKIPGKPWPEQMTIYPDRKK
jgi:hypothetical protein